MNRSVRFVLVALVVAVLGTALVLGGVAFDRAQAATGGYGMMGGFDMMGGSGHHDGMMGGSGHHAGMTGYCSDDGSTPLPDGDVRGAVQR